MEFCYDCTTELAGKSNNSFAGLAKFHILSHLVANCEGCGVHAFNNEGQRMCLQEIKPFERIFNCWACLEIHNKLVEQERALKL